MPQPAALAGVRAAFDASTAASPPLWTALRYLAFSRVVVSGLLALLFTFGDLSTMFDTAYDRQMFARVAWFYLTIALVFVAVVVRLPRAYLSQMALHVGTDLVLLVLLIHFAGGPRSGLGVLVVIAIAGAAVPASQRLAIAFAARSESRCKNSKSVSASDRKLVTTTLRGSARGSVESFGVINTRQLPPPGNETKRQGTLAPPICRHQAPGLNSKSICFA